jgi:hypothetical protein
MLPGMDAMAPVPPDVPWAVARCVNASRAAAASPKKTTFDFIWFFLLKSHREVGPHL